MLKDEIPVSWRVPLEPFTGIAKGQTILQELNTLLQRDTGNYNPVRADVFAALRATSFNDVRVVIIGQDPYPNPDYATGLAFSMPDDEITLSQSIKGIYRAVQNNFNEVPENGNLDHWARQDVLLLNRSLTFHRNNARINREASRKWLFFTKAVVKALSDSGRPIHFMLWGSKVRKIKWPITIPPCRRHEACHPVARLGRDRDFRNCTHFSVVNNALGEERIDWIRDPN